MRLIDADKLLENIEKRIKGAKSLAEVVDLTNIECITDVQQSVPAVPLDRIKAAREEIANYQSVHDSYCEHIEKGDFWDGHTPNHYESSGGKATACDYFLQILDKLIAEVEG